MRKNVAAEENHVTALVVVQVLHAKADIVSHPLALLLHAPQIQIALLARLAKAAHAKKPQQLQEHAAMGFVNQMKQLPVLRTVQVNQAAANHANPMKIAR